MDKDVEAIGAHCQVESCHLLDFLPFKCESCHGWYCLDHRTETAHSCPKAGAWARQQIADRQTASPSPKPPAKVSEAQCYEPTCKTPVGTGLSTDHFCDSCRRLYCLKHRFPNSHGCTQLQPAGIADTISKGQAALEKLKAWGAARKAVLTTSSSSATASRYKAAVQLKNTAKGDDKIESGKRIYLHVEAQSDTVTAKVRSGEFYYSADWSVGKVLDAAAKHLQVENVNNQNKETERLALFHIEGGRVLKFSEKLGEAVQTGNTIVLLRGVMI